MGSLQGDGGFAGGEGADVVRDGSARRRDAASRIPGGQVRDTHTHLYIHTCTFIHIVQIFIQYYPQKYNNKYPVKVLF